LVWNGEMSWRRFLRGDMGVGNENIWVGLGGFEFGEVGW